MRPTISCVPDAVQRERYAKRCTADPGPPQTGTVLGLQRTTIAREDGRERP